MSREQIEEMAKTIEQSGMIDSYSRCEIVADELYAADYRKQVEGEWIWKSNGYMKHLHCSCCGKQEEWETAYCPNCGAKMKGGN